MNFLIPQGIGDSIWALHKVQAVARAHNEKHIDIFLNCSTTHGQEARALDFVRRFSFVRSAAMLPINIMADPFIDEGGRYNYMKDGWIDEIPGIFALMPNHPLERGVRLEDWLPEYETNWQCVDEIAFTADELTIADAVRQRSNGYAVLFMGSLTANTDDGHNRCGLWTQFDWVSLGDWLHERHGIDIVTVGATCDETYFDSRIAPNIAGKSWWHNHIGQHSIWETFAICRQARLCISYQSGIGIFSNYMGVPTGIFWRAKGDSIRADTFVSFEESMASAWANPQHIEQRRHLPLIYGRHDPAYIKRQIMERKW